MNYYNGTYQSSVVDSLQALWFKVLSFLPNIIAAIIFLILGWLIAIFLGQLVKKILVSLKVDKFADRLGLDTLSQRTGRKLTISGLGEWLIKWFVLIGVFIAAAEILGLTQVSAFLYGRIFPYFGNVIVAVAMLMIGIIAANFLADLVKGALQAGQMRSANALAAVTRWSIIIMAVLTAMGQLSIDTEFIKSLFIGIVAMLSIAGGLAFGLGGRDHAKKVLDAIEKDITR
ncbi:MAG: small-conductance mechanosensitive ion channel [Candidatus Doudnabacteria bacterium]|nr:small-conductance mechanosensitive ion channel [Candidatus Doudnabacteria bacterium]